MPQSISEKNSRKPAAPDEADPDFFLFPHETNRRANEVRRKLFLLVRETT